MYLLSKTQQARTGLIRKALSVPMKHHECTGFFSPSVFCTLVVQWLQLFYPTTKQVLQNVFIKQTFSIETVQLQVYF